MSVTVLQAKATFRLAQLRRGRERLRMYSNDLKMFLEIFTVVLAVWT